MKCPKCGGTGWDIVHGFDCVSCDGKGEIEVTNEEWFCGLSTEEKAKFFKGISEKCLNCGGTIEYDEIGECPFGRCRTGLNEY